MESKSDISINLPRIVGIAFDLGCIRLDSSKVYDPQWFDVFLVINWLLRDYGAVDVISRRGSELPRDRGSGDANPSRALFLQIYLRSQTQPGVD